MLTSAQVAEIKKRAEHTTVCACEGTGFCDCERVEELVRVQKSLLADRGEFVRRLAEAEAELEGLREIATSGPSTASGPGPLSHRRLKLATPGYPKVAAPMEEA